MSDIGHQRYQDACQISERSRPKPLYTYPVHSILCGILYETKSNPGFAKGKIENATWEYQIASFGSQYRMAGFRISLPYVLCIDKISSINTLITNGLCSI